MNRKTLLALLAGALLCSVAANNARAGVVFNITQEAGGVRIVGSGSYDLTGATMVGGGVQDGFINSSLGLAVGGPFGPVDFYSLVLNPGAFGSGTFFFGSPDVGDRFGLDVINSGGFLTVPDGYASGQTLAGSTFFSGQSYASLGLVVGTWVYGIPSDTLTVNVRSVPEPGTFALLGLGLVGLGFSKRRKTA